MVYILHIKFVVVLVRPVSITRSQHHKKRQHAQLWSCPCVTGCVLPATHSAGCFHRQDAAEFCHRVAWSSEYSSVQASICMQCASVYTLDVHACVSVHACVHVCVHARVRACMCACVRACVHACACACACACMRACVRVCVCRPRGVCVCVCVCL